MKNQKRIEKFKGENRLFNIINEADFKLYGSI